MTTLEFGACVWDYISKICPHHSCFPLFDFPLNARSLPFQWKIMHNLSKLQDVMILFDNTEILPLDELISSCKKR